MAEQPYENSTSPTRGEYTLGEPAKDVYGYLCKGREVVVETSREMAELTIPSVFPPEGYKVGEKLPGNNQSVGAQCVNTLASKLMFMAFPPGQPIAIFEPVETALQAEIDRDPQLYGRIQLALSRLEESHRKRFQLTPLATAYVGYIKLLLVSGNALWKHVKLNSPTYHRCTDYVVSRAANGHPMVTIHKEKVRVATLPEDVQDMILSHDEKLADVPEWEREATIYSVCKFKGNPSSDNEEGSWLYWEEYEGRLIEGSEVETDYDDCPMWPGWLIPVYGDNWGRSYCEEYRGDLYTVEANSSSLNDGAALAAWALTFVTPGARTSIRQVKKAPNLSILSGNAADVTTYRTEKGADFNFVSNHLQGVVRRLGSAFLLFSAMRREGERVTKEEVERTGAELDQAMGGLYTEIAQTQQRRIIMRAINLHTEEDPNNIPAMPKDLVRVGVITGTDAMGRNRDATTLTTFARAMRETFPTEDTLNSDDFGNRLAAALGIKPEGLVKTAEQRQAEQQQQLQMQAGMTMLDKATGPLAGKMAEAMVPQPSEPQEGSQ